MSIHLAMPWAPKSRTYCLPGSVVMKMALGEAPETIPVYADVSNERQPAAPSLDGGVIDRVVAHHAGIVRISRLHASAASLQRPGARQGRHRRIAIVALARKLLIAFWRFATFGEIPEGATLKIA
jgi:hypothetical protein